MSCHLKKNPDIEKQKLSGCKYSLDVIESSFVKFSLQLEPKIINHVWYTSFGIIYLASKIYMNWILKFFWFIWYTIRIYEYWISYAEITLWDINFFVYLILVFLQQKIDLSDFLIQLSNEKLLCLWYAGKLITCPV